MKTIILLSVILLISLLLTGCSYVYDFIIVNNSDSVLEVEYKWKENLDSTPYKYKFESFDGKRFEKLNGIYGFTKEEIASAEEINTFRILLEPKQALRIHSVPGGERKEIAKKVDEFFRINFLRLKGKKGSIELTDKQVWFQFNEMEQGYFISYK